MLWWVHFLKKILLFIPPSVQDTLCCAPTVCVIVILRFEKSLNSPWLLTDPPRSAGLLCFVALLPSPPPPPPHPRQIKSLVVLGNARSNEAGWSGAQKGPNMVFKRSEMEASALMERIIVAGGPPFLVNTIKRGSGPGPARPSPRSRRGELPGLTYLSSHWPSSIQCYRLAPPSSPLRST